MQIYKTNLYHNNIYKNKAISFKENLKSDKKPTSVLDEFDMEDYPFLRYASLKTDNFLYSKSISKDKQSKNKIKAFSKIATAFLLGAVSSAKLSPAKVEPEYVYVNLDNTTYDFKHRTTEEAIKHLNNLSDGSISIFNDNGKYFLNCLKEYDSNNPIYKDFKQYVQTNMPLTMSIFTDEIDYNVKFKTNDDVINFVMELLNEFRDDGKYSYIFSKKGMSILEISALDTLINNISKSDRFEVAATANTIDEIFSELLYVAMEEKYFNMVEHKFNVENKDNDKIKQLVVEISELYDQYFEALKNFEENDDTESFVDFIIKFVEFNNKFAELKQIAGITNESFDLDISENLAEKFKEAILKATEATIV